MHELVNQYAVLTRIKPDGESDLELTIQLSAALCRPPMEAPILSLYLRGCKERSEAVLALEALSTLVLDHVEHEERPPGHVVILDNEAGDEVSVECAELDMERRGMRDEDWSLLVEACEAAFQRQQSEQAGLERALSSTRSWLRERKERELRIVQQSPEHAARGVRASHRLQAFEEVERWIAAQLEPPPPEPSER